jgi:hypothetical protein
MKATMSPAVPVERTVTLEMTETQAEHLYAALEKTNWLRALGGPNYDPDGFAMNASVTKDNITEALRAAGVRA